jgi:DNA-directed RNA polymerase subunit RPC12/RpoP
MLIAPERIGYTLKEDQFYMSKYWCTTCGKDGAEIILVEGEEHFTCAACQLDRLKIQFEVTKFVDIFKLNELIAEKYGFVASKLDGAAHHEKMLAFNNHGVTGNGCLVLLTFSALAKECAHPEARMLFELYDLETKHLQDDKGQLQILYWW